MPSNYPAQIDTNITLPVAPPNTPNVSGNVYNQLRNAVVAIETELGVNPSGTNNTVVARLDTIENAVLNFQGLTLGGDIGNSPADPFVIGIQGRPISSVQPSLGNTLVWNGIAWVPSLPLTFSGDLFGTIYSQKVIAIQGNAVSPIKPTVGQLLVWNGSSWIPTTPIGGDLSGNITNETVIGIQGRPVSNNQPLNGQLLSWNGSTWTPMSLSGDLSGTFNKQNVIGIYGASVPQAGSLNTGNTLQVSGNSSLSYGPINLAGGANYVSGLLPTTNQVSQTMLGDVTGTTANSTVAKIQNVPVSSTMGNNDVLTVTVPITDPIDIIFDGTYLWAIDGFYPLLYKINPTTKNVLSTINFSTGYSGISSSLAGTRLTYDSNNIYIGTPGLVSTSPSVVIISKSTGAVIGLGAAVFSSLGDTVYGLAVNGNDLYVATAPNSFNGTYTRGYITHYSISAVIANQGVFTSPTTMSPATTSGEIFTDITYGGGYAWAVSSANTVRKTNSALTVLSEYSAVTNTIRCIYAFNSIWITNGGIQILRLNPISFPGAGTQQALLTTAALYGYNYSLTYDSSTIWIGDKSLGIATRIATTLGSESVIIKILSNQNVGFTGLAFDGTLIWAAASISTPMALYEFSTVSQTFLGYTNGQQTIVANPPAVYLNNQSLTTSRVFPSEINNLKMGITNFGSDTTLGEAGATGSYSTISGGDAHIASGNYSVVAGGQYNKSLDNYTFTAGLSCKAGDGSNDGIYAAAIGYNNTATGYASFAQGQSTNASNNGSHAEGVNTVASGACSHAEGFNTIASGDYSHAEGVNVTVSGSYSHGEGFNTTAGTASFAHAEGDSTFAGGSSSHAEGNSTFAFGVSSHAGGQNTTANGAYSYSGGLYSLALRNSQASRASGFFTTAGDSQYSWGLVLIGSTPGSVTGESVELTFSIPSNYFQLEDGKGYTIKIEAVAEGEIIGAFSQSVRGWTQTLVVRQDSGNITLNSGTQELIGDSGASSWTLTASVGSSPTRLKFTFSTGSTASAARCVCALHWVEVAHS